jgi:hypothetical protein
LKGFGDGGVFAVLEGAPGIRPSDISFMWFWVRCEEWAIASYKAFGLG